MVSHESGANGIGSGESVLARPPIKFNFCMSYMTSQTSEIHALPPELEEQRNLEPSFGTPPTPSRKKYVDCYKCIFRNVSFTKASPKLGILDRSPTRQVHVLVFAFHSSEDLQLP
jgi:hypothetical protein